MFERVLKNIWYLGKAVSFQLGQIVSNKGLLCSIVACYFELPAFPGMAKTYFIKYPPVQLQILTRNPTDPEKV